MSKGRRYSNEGKLNYKKVFAVMLAIIVIIMFIMMIKNLAKKAKETTNTVKLDYYALYEDNKWGILSTSGEKIIEPMYQEMITVVDNSKDVFICTYDVNEETGEYKTKVINSKNQEIFIEYEKVEAIGNIDLNGNAWYEKEVLKVEKDGKYGLINLEGKEILKIEYESIEPLKGIEDSLIVKKDGLVGLVNTVGSMIIDVKYTKIEAFGKSNKDGYITIDSMNKYGVVNSTGTVVLKNEYEKVENIYGGKYFVVTEKGKQKLIDDDGENIITKGFDKIIQIGSDGIIFIKDKKYGFMDYSGKVIIKPQYESIKQINTDAFVVKKDGKCGIIDGKNTKKIQFNYSDIYYEGDAGIYIAEDEKYNSSIIDSEFNIKLEGILSELNTDKGYMKLKIGDEYKYYNFRFEEKNITDILTANTLFVGEKDGKYGYVDIEGNVIVDYIYDEALEQNIYGYAAVQKDGLWGAIDKNGKEVISPKYNLDNNLIIDFIGKWHLGQDLNMNYYCEK